ncbi:MAG TPA: hypothetical protein VE569_09965 [Acidimicrobiia bacterium]|nr:hypothetical protein [Acidimicrobiia bacterium]
MSRSTRTANLSPAWVVSLSAGLVAIVAAVLGYTEVAEVVGGGVLILLALLAGRPVTKRLAVETDPGRQLVWNVLLVLVIVVALVGVGVMAAALPVSP